MIYSLLSEDINTANLTNLIPNNINFKEDIYIEFLNEFKKNINLYMPDGSYFNRKFSKMILMPIFYNMGKRGIRKLLKETLLDTNIIDDKTILTPLINYIQNILFKKFNNTIYFQKNLVEICEQLKKQNISIKFYTLDGTLIIYSYLKINYTYGAIKNFGKKSTYRIASYETNNQIKELSENHYLTFPPNFIQSIDGSLCRIIANLYFQITNAILEPLHDSFRVPFKNINILQTIIKYTYSFIFFNKLFHEKKLGIEKDKIKFNSKTYLNYKKYFSFIENNKIKLNQSDIITNNFIFVLDLNRDDKTKYKNKMDLLINKEFQNFLIEDNLIKLLNSKFMFYF